MDHQGNVRRSQAGQVSNVQAARYQRSRQRMVKVTSRVQQLTGSAVQRIRQKNGQVKPGVKQETISRVKRIS
ncbi:unnamed protein product [Staurois parvus]|uniref:Uncharacterized protein n=1 Tax=Staurois parvus TaxID=386267 RepID=A0ABN9C5X0_9NEOB|nr:unnamed protein product [Staurois parvus]